MKTQIRILKSLSLIAFVSIIFSCTKDKVDPALVLDEVLVPEGYHQNDDPSSEALSRLEELRLEHPDDHFYYLERENKSVTSAREWVFPQKELKIEHADFEKASNKNQNAKLMGVIVKKIKGNWRDEVFVVLNNQPSPKAGFKEFFKYVSENLKYPEEAKKLGLEGKVFVQFIVDDKGKLTKVQAVKGIGGGCDEEAIRVLKDAPNWNPAMVVDMPVKTRMILPITYQFGPSAKGSSKIEEVVFD